MDISRALLRHFHEQFLQGPLSDAMTHANSPSRQRDAWWEPDQPPQPPGPAKKGGSTK